MRRIALVFVLLACAVAAPHGSVTAAPSVAASLVLDPAPSWETADQGAQVGSWVKHSSPVVADLGSGPAILVGDSGGRLYALRYSGSSLTKTWDSGSAIQTFIQSSPAVADLDRDGCPDVLVGAGSSGAPGGSGMHVFDCHGGNHRYWAAPGQPGVSKHIGVFSTPAIGDVNGDGSPDVAYGSFNTKIYVKDARGRDLAGWPRDNYDTIWSSPAMADIDGNASLEIVIGTDLGGGGNNVLGCAKAARGTVSVFNGAGHFTQGFPKCMDTPIWSTPAVQDVNGDGTLDLVVGTGNFTENGANVGQSWIVRAYDTRTGRLLWATPLAQGSRIFASPAIGDVGGDGSLDVAIGTVADGVRGQLYLLDAHTGRIKWQRYGAPERACNTCPGFLGSPVIADVDGDGRPDVVAATQEGLYAWDASGSAVIDDFRPRASDGSVESYQFNNSPAVADLDGDGKSEIVLAGAIRNTNPLRGKVWIVDTAGRGNGPWPVFKRTPDRISSVGSGRRVAGAAPARRPITPTRTPYVAPRTTTHTASPATAAPATLAPYPTPEMSTSPPLAMPSEAPHSSGTNTAVAWIAAGFLTAAGGSLLLLRRYRRP